MPACFAHPLSGPKLASITEPWVKGLEMDANEGREPGGSCLFCTLPYLGSVRRSILIFDRFSVK